MCSKDFFRDFYDCVEILKQVGLNYTVKTAQSNLHEKGDLHVFSPM